MKIRHLPSSGIWRKDAHYAVFPEKLPVNSIKLLAMKTAFVPPFILLVNGYNFLLTFSILPAYPKTRQPFS
ncbi:MAG: hypothetical protein LBB53_02880 [Prevotellaceae bacterium]|nr:hypothetical protein [Prevotellaceae bacterium]